MSISLRGSPTDIIPLLRINEEYEAMLPPLRERVLGLYLEGYGPRIIASQTGRKQSAVRTDIRWLKKNGYITPSQFLRKKFRPTSDMITQMTRWLRQDRTYGFIAGELGVSANTILTFMSTTKDTRIRLAREYRRRLHEAKKQVRPRTADLEETKFSSEMGMSLDEWSDCNLLWVNEHSPEMLSTTGNSRINRLLKSGFMSDPIWETYWGNRDESSTV